MTLRTIAFSAALALASSATVPAPALAELPMPDHVFRSGGSVDTSAARARLDQGQQQLLRCSAAFALLSHLKASGDVADLPAMPATDERMREYFVRAGAELMEKAGLNRAELSALVEEDVLALSQQGALHAAMPLCAASLNASAL